jgi:signal transduction histidine kinase
MPKLVAASIDRPPTNRALTRVVIPSGSRPARSKRQTIRLKSKIVIASPQALSERNRPQAAETLLAVSQTVGARLDVSEILHQTTRELVQALGADIGTVFRLDGDRAVQQLARYGGARTRSSSSSTSSTSSTSSRAAVTSALWERLMTAAVKADGPVCSVDSANDPRFDRSVLRLFPHRSVLIQPLRVRGNTAGVFAFIWNRAQHTFSDIEIRLVAAVAAHAGIAVENAELAKEIHRLNLHLEERVRDRTERLQRACDDLEASREALRALTTRLERVRESERTRIAREIHDELGQALTSLKIEMTRDTTANGDRHIRELASAVDSLIEDVRRIASELRPPILDDLGLVEALDWHARDFGKRTGIKMRFRTTGAPVDRDADRSTALFRIFQEILTNVARHAEATLVQVSFAGLQRAVRLDVRDNGRGMADVLESRRRGLGMLGMQERAAACGGRVEFSSLARRGTRVRVYIPWPRRVDHHA